MHSISSFTRETMRITKLLAIFLLSQLHAIAHSDDVVNQAPPCDVVPKVTHTEIPDSVRLKNKYQVMEAIVIVTINTKGRVSDAVIAESSDPSFDKPALRAARKWRFEPPAQACKARIPMALRAVNR
jgi:TonB family protein